MFWRATDWCTRGVRQSEAQTRQIDGFAPPSPAGYRALMKLAILLLAGAALAGAGATAWRVHDTFPMLICSAAGHCHVDPNDQPMVGYSCRTVRSGSLKPDWQVCTYP